MTTLQNFSIAETKMREAIEEIETAKDTILEQLRHKRAKTEQAQALFERVIELGDSFWGAIDTLEDLYDSETGE